MGEYKEMDNRNLSEDQLGGITGGSQITIVNKGKCTDCGEDIPEDYKDCFRVSTTNNMITTLCENCYNIRKLKQKGKPTMGAFQEPIKTLTNENNAADNENKP